MPMHGPRWVVTGLVDQVVIAAANAGMTLMAALVIPSDRAGTLLLAIGLGYLVLALDREIVGNVLLAKVSRLDGVERDRMVRNALAAAAAVGVLAALVLLAVWTFWRHPAPRADLQDLVWLAPLLPAILVHDTARYAYLSDRDPAGALRIDLVWVGVQASLLAIGLAVGIRPAMIPVSWGLGAVAGATTYLLRTRTAIWRGDPRRWLAETRSLSGWFTATGIIAQLQVQAVGFVTTGQLAPRQLTYLRAGQTTLLNPVQNFVTAMMGLLVPRSSRLAAARQVTGLHRQTVRVAGAFVGLAAVLVALMVPLAHLAVRHVSRLHEVGPLILPISVQAGIYLVQVPFAAAIRGMQRGRLLFLQYLIFSVTSLAGLVVGAGSGRLAPAAWGLVTGSAVGLVVFVGCYVWATTGLRSTASDPAADAAPPKRNASPASR